MTWFKPLETTNDHNLSEACIFYLVVAGFQGVSTASRVRMVIIFQRRLKKNEKRYEEALQHYTPEEIFLLYGDYQNWNKHSRRYSGTGKKYTGITVKDVGTHKKDNGTASQK